MNLDEIYTLVATLLGFFGAIYMGQGVLQLTASMIAKQVTTYWGYNLEQLKSIAMQKADFCIGLCLIGFAFIIQVFNIIVKQKDNFYSRREELLIIGIATLIVMFIMGKIGNFLQGKYVLDAKKDLFMDNLCKAKKKYKIYSSKGKKEEAEVELLDVQERGKHLFGFNRNANEGAREYIKRLANLLEWRELRQFKID
ncbi:MAG: hypothetical protein ABII88_08890 [Candidatus Omnitrophota bacterium]